MSARLLDLEDRIITDTGSMVAKHKLLVQLALSGRPFSHLPFEPHPDIDAYHHHAGTKQHLRWREDDEVRGPSPDTYEWITPPPWSDADIREECGAALRELGITDPRYQERLVAEFDHIESRQMEPFFRCLLWITDMLREHNTLWGLGRGSGCASLVLFLLGITKVDPVRYDIPMAEFYK